MEYELRKAGPFAVKSEEYDFCVVVEEKELWVPKHFLSFLSPVFKKMCFDEQFSEAKNGRVSLEEEKYEELLVLFKSTIPHPCVEPVSDLNLEVLLKLGSFFMMESLLSACKNFVRLRLEQRSPGMFGSAGNKKNPYCAYLATFLKHCPEDADMINRIVHRVCRVPVEHIFKWESKFPPEVVTKIYKLIIFKYGKQKYSQKKCKKCVMYFCLCEP